MCITFSEVHTAEYFIDMAEKLIAGGADEICLKDMAGIGRPAMLGKIVKAIKTAHPHIVIQYHGHSGPGFSMASMLAVAEAGADYLDIAMEPLSWGMVHPDVISVQAMLKDAGFKVPEINMNAYMKARKMTQSFIDDFLGYFIDERNKYMTSLLVGCGLPGGMMGSLMADLKAVHAGINSFLKGKGEPELNEDELLVKLFEEVNYIWPKLGYPPLVTPFSQYVKNVAIMNIMNLIKGQGRWQMIDKNTWDMILGKAGQLPGPLDPEIIELAKKNNFEFFTGDPQSNYPDELPKYIAEMKEKGWKRGKDDEELFEFAMHDKQYRDFKSGEAKRRFEKELEAAIREKYSKVDMPDITVKKIMYPNAEPVKSSVSGTILWELDFHEQSTEPIPGKVLKTNDLLCSIQTKYGLEHIQNIRNSRIVSVQKRQGEKVQKGETICYIETENVVSQN